MTQVIMDGLFEFPYYFVSYLKRLLGILLRVPCYSVVVLNGNAGSSPAIIHVASLREVFLSVRSSSIASGN